MQETIAGSTATELAALVRDGRVTAVEVTRAYLARIGALEPRIGAFDAVLAREAVEEASRVPAGSELPLAGVPVAIKNVVDVEGQPTIHGSAALDAPPASRDDETVARLRAAGAVVIGKTRGPELSIWPFSDNAGGTAVNPWDPTRVSGGSSGGSAAAVAAGMVPLALGSDGLGSIRIPAATCGLFGIKPGSGVVPITVAGRDEHWFGMTQYGPLATTVDDAALMLDVLAGTDRHRAPTVPDRSLRVAVSVRAPGPGIAVDARYRDAVVESARHLRVAGHTVRRADPPYAIGDVPAIVQRWLQGAARDADDLGLDVERAEPRTRGHVAAGRRLRGITPVDDADAQDWQARMAGFFEDHDVLLMPALAQLPPRAKGWRDRSWTANVVAAFRYAPMASPWNLADLPAASVPAGTTEDGLPLAVQVVAPHGEERRVLAVARQLEEQRPWRRIAPLGR